MNNLMSSFDFATRTIYIRGDIELGTCEIIDKALIAFRSDGSPPIAISISSRGGSVSAGLHVCDLFNLYKGKKIAFVSGKASSMAAIILQVCDVRICTPHAEILIHGTTQQLSYDIYNSKRRMKRFERTVRKLQQATEAILSKRTGLSVKKLRSLYDRRLSAQEALKYHLIDQIL